MRAPIHGLARLLDAEVELADLRMGNNTYNGTEFGDAIEFILDILSSVRGVLGGVLGISLLLGLEPILVAATLELLAQMLGKDSGEGAETAWGLNVSHDTDDDHGGCFEDGDSVDDFALVAECTGTVNATDDVGHSGLVATEGCEVWSSGGIIFGEGADAAGVTLGTLLGEELERSVTGGFELTMGPRGFQREGYTRVSKRT